MINEVFILVVIAALLYLCVQVSGFVAEQRRQSYRLSKLLEYHGMSSQGLDAPSEQVKELARTKGAGIEAIKAYREQTGLGFKEAKAVVQSLCKPSPGEA